MFLGSTYILAVCNHTESMYLHSKYLDMQEICTHAGSMASHRSMHSYRICTYVRSMHSQWTYKIIIIIMCTYSLVHGMGVDFFLEKRGRKILEVEGTGLDAGETLGLFALGVDGEGERGDCEGDHVESPEVMYTQKGKYLKTIKKSNFHHFRT